MRARRPNPRAARVVQRVASHCLHYPDRRLRDLLPLLRRGLAETSPGTGLDPLLDHLERTPPVAAAGHYVEVFDTEADRCLHLTWYTDGDTRRRGGALSEVKGTYRRYGFGLADGELPDYLPALLEFAALTGEPGQRLLAGFRPALTVLHDNLRRLRTPYADAVRAVVATLPPNGGARPAAPRPPTERVGLEPVLLGYPTTRPEHTR